MAQITFIEFDGTEHVLDIDNGTSIMQAAIDHNVRGIMADCGGACSCATCHVYIDPQFADKLSDKSEMEDILLEEVCEPAETSRLSCQISVSDELDGMVVRMPERQI
ncbi:2Fe-2S iron-sulfur cluster-binding protein [Litorivivens sp.]|uniref:2Fe-2S iron-sulfur cluster-binding protein n=1 Tax=Litorivivens sp. TaxID=2020868 RepID=UPI00356506FC